MGRKRPPPPFDPHSAARFLPNFTFSRGWAEIADSAHRPDRSPEARLFSLLSLGRLLTRQNRRFGKLSDRTKARMQQRVQERLEHALRDVALAAHDRGELRSLEDVGAAHDECAVYPWLLEKGTMPKCGSTRGKTGLIISCGPKSSDLFGLRGCSRSVSISTR
jgi:hypothetical protein